MDDEKLIECVRKYEFLFNAKHPKYMDSLKKERAWKDIAEQMKQPAAICKQRWQCLRDAYRRALNKKKGKTGQAAKNVKPWKYENEMAFVAPFFVSVDRKALCTTIDLDSDDETSEDGNENVTMKTEVPESADTGVGVDESAVDFEAINSAETNKVQPVMKQAVDSELSLSAMLKVKLLEDLNKFEPPSGQDELDRFFLNIAETVRKFSPYQQILAKGKIFNLVSEMELQQYASS